VVKTGTIDAVARGMKRVLVLTALALGLSGGVALADRHHGGGWRGGGSAAWHGGVTVRPSAPARVYYNRPTYYNRPAYYSYSRPRFVRRPIYVTAPAIRYHYYNYYQRPSIVVENYPARDGYIWVAGQWSWDGYEWRWTPGHYEPDANWVDPNASYDYSYDYNAGY
jgi:hypothetical protein